jgi:hypothetical protein
LSLGIDQVGVFMADSASQVVLSQEFSSQVTNTQVQNLISERRYRNSSNTDTIEYFLTLNEGNTAQKTHFNVGGTIAPDDILAVRVQAPGTDEEYLYRVKTGDTFAKVIEGLVSRIGMDSAVVAQGMTASNSGTVNLTAAIPGQTFSVSTANVGAATTTMSTPVTTVTGSSSATIMHRKIAELTLNWGASADSSQRIQVSGNFDSFDGAVLSQRVNRLAIPAYKHTLSINQIQAAQSG